LDERLALRIRLFREGGQVRPQVVEFVAGELRALSDEGHTLTDDTAGMLTSHLMMALTRLVDGEAIEEFAADQQVAAELARHPEALAAAHGVAARARTELGAVLPESEINFLGLHLAVLAQHLPASNSPAPNSPAPNSKDGP
jgi:PRD domain